MLPRTLVFTPKRLRHPSSRRVSYKDPQRSPQLVFTLNAVNTSTESNAASLYVVAYLDNDFYSNRISTELMGCQYIFE